MNSYSFCTFGALKSSQTLQNTHKHLVEVNCGFQFPQETAQWDITLFGQFYEIIKTKGFTHREDRKGFQITFGPFNKSQEKIPVSEAQAEDQVLFKDPSRGYVILMGKGKISFHCIEHYKGWEEFLHQFIKPFFESYLSLGLGNGIRQCSIVYLNRYFKDTSSDLSEYFTIVSKIDQKFGREVNTHVQRVISNDDNYLIAKLNSQIIDEAKAVIELECGAICRNNDCMLNDNWIDQAYKTHAPIFDFYQTILTSKQLTDI